MNILLAYPPCLNERITSDDACVVPIGLYCIGALLLKHGHDVEIVNLSNPRASETDIRNLLLEKQPDMFGLSIFNANRWSGIEAAEIAKKINPGMITVFGGVGATFLWEHFLTHFDCIDYIVLGEGEFSFLKLIDHLENEKSPPFSLSGIAFKYEKQLYQTDPGDPVQNLDSVPLPATYFTFQHLALTRGCPGKCSFCGSPAFWGSGPVRSHSPGYFVDQIETLTKKGVTFFYVSDDTFTLKSSTVITICKEVIKRNLRITWVAISRVDCINEEILYWMRMAGCIQISFGVESGSSRIRKRLGKHINDKDVSNAFHLCTRYGILPRAYFIYGSPGETWETIHKTIDLMVSIRPLSMISYLLVIFPGTELYQTYKTLKQVSDDIWLEKIEDVPWIDAEPEISPELAKQFGQKIRDEFKTRLLKFIDAIDLVDKREMSELHADFLSRLALTFSHGDYADIENSTAAAERLFTKALTFFPDQRAYLGLGMLYQKNREFTRSISILENGCLSYPESEDLALCLGLNWMNLGNFEKALDCFRKFKESEKFHPYIMECRKQLDNS